MGDLADMAERHEAILGELAQLGLALARDLQARAAAADDAETAAGLGLAFQRVARSVRQTLALEAKLAAERRKPEAIAQQLKEKNRAIRRRHEQVRAVVEQRICDGFEGDVREELLDELHERLGDELLEEDFGIESVDEQVERLCRELSLHAPELREPPSETFERDVDPDPDTVPGAPIHIDPNDPWGPAKAAMIEKLRTGHGARVAADEAAAAGAPSTEPWRSSA